ncbi:MAG: magnesium transporter [Erysipelotrichaceae bacterium]|nr:magnesium transporter [Erysipelotrichaceae bacterium]
MSKELQREEVMNEERLRQMIEDREAAELSEYITENNPIDVAQAAEDLDDDELWKMCSLLPSEDIASVMEQADDDLRVRLADTLTNNELVEIFHNMAQDDIADIIGDLSIGRRKSIFNMMMDNEKAVIKTLLEYPEESAGGIMTTAYIAIKDDLKVSQALEKIRDIAPKIEVIETIFVVDTRGQLIGTVDLRDILSSGKDAMIADIMKENVISVQPEVDQEEVAKLVSKYDLNAIPVVNHRKAILGIITVDDIIDVIVEEYNEDILEMGGVSKEESLDTTLVQSIKLRLPWLLINLLTAFMASLTVKAFEGTIAQVVALSSIMTIISGMGGNAGSQTQSILVREIATNDVNFKKDWPSFVKEIFLGVINGAINGLITAVIVAVIYHNFFLGVITVIAMIGNLVVAGIFGFLVPVVLRKLGADPAVSSSIFVTTATDVLGFFIFLGLANLFLPLLL